MKKHTIKILSLALIGTMSISALVGCGKKEEQTQIDQSAYEQMKSEAEAEHEQFKKEQDEKQQGYRDATAERDEFEQNELVRLEEYYEKFISAETEIEISNSANEYNKIIDNVSSKYSEEGKNQIAILMEVSYVPYRISDEAVSAKTILLKNMKEPYSSFIVCSNAEDNSTPVVVCVQSDDSTSFSGDLKIITLDGKENIVDLGEYSGEMQRLTFDNYQDNSVIINRQDFDKGDNYKVKIDILSGQTTKLEGDYESNLGCVVSDYYFDTSIEDISKNILGHFNAFGN